MRINLLPPVPPLVRIRIWVVTLISALLLLTCALLGASWYISVQETGAQRFLLSEQQLALRALSAKWSAVQKSLGQATLARQAQAFAASQARPSRGLLALFAVVAPDARVNNISYAKGVLTGTITAPTLSIAATTIARLQTGGVFRGVTVHSVSLGSGSAVQIAFAAELPGGARAGGN